MAIFCGELVGCGTSSSKVETVAREPKVETVGIKGEGIDNKNGNFVKEYVDKDEGNNAVEDNDLNQ